MSVVITNISTHDDLTGENEYVVRINNQPALARFSHIRRDGLAACLRRAADALDLQAAEEIKEFAAALARTEDGGRDVG